MDVIGLALAGQIPVSAENGYGTWLIGNTTPQALLNAFSGVIGGALWTVGGTDASGNAQNFIQKHTGLIHQQQTSALATARNGGVSGVLNNDIYLLGGYDVTGNNNRADTYNVVTNNGALTSIGTVPAHPNGQPLGSSSGSVQLNGVVYFGGHGGYPLGQNVQNYFRSFTLSSRTWATLANVPETTAYASLWAYNGSVYLLTGNNNGASQVGSNNLYRYSVSGNTWASLGALAVSATYGRCVVQVGSLVYLFGGQVSSSYPAYRLDLSVSETAVTTVTTLPSTPTAYPATNAMTGYAFDDRRVQIIGGGNAGNGHIYRDFYVDALYLSKLNALKARLATS